MRVVDTDQYTRPCRGEAVSGDVAVIDAKNGHVLVGIIDVLGHGEEAHALALEMETFLLERWTPSVTETLDGLHEGFRGSRGAAVGIGVLDVDSGKLHFAGVGNTVIRKFGPRPATLPSRDGVVGIRMRPVREEVLHLANGEVVVLYTDGVRSHFDASEYPGLSTDSSREVAANVVDRFGKEHDDASCIALRYAR